MRSSTKSAIGAITLGVLGLTYNIGQQTVVATHTFSAPPVATPAPSNGSASPSTSASPKPSSSSSAGKPPTTKPVTPPATTPPATTPPATSTAADGSVIQSGYGTVQVHVTKTAGKITDVSMVLANATNGRAAAFSYLIQSAISANGSNFANLSGATYTTNAFKKSLDAALLKL